MKVLCKIAVVLFFCMISFIPSVLAEDTANKPNIVLVYSNNTGNTSLNYDGDLANKLQDRFTALFSSKYNVIIGSPYSKQLQDAGIMNLSTTERIDIIPYFKKDNIQYIVIFELEPVFVSDANQSYQIKMGLVHLKIIDVNKNSYLYNGEFMEKSNPFLGGGTSGAALQIFKNATKQVFLPKLLNETQT
jgi:hypothetical protein